MTKFITIILIAGRSLFANKLRSVLTILGIIIGVAAVVAMLSIGRGAQNVIDAQLHGLGTNLLFVLPGGSSIAGIQGESGTVGTLTLADADAIADPINVPAVVAVAPVLNATGQVVYQDRNTRPRIMGVTPEFERVRNSSLLVGEFIQPGHVASRSNVALVGSTVTNNLFGDEDPLGKWLRINNVPFRVIGVLQKKGATGFIDQDDVVLVPITTVQSRLVDSGSYRGGSTITGINVQVASSDQMEEAVEQISTVLRKRHRIRYEDDFDIIGQDEVLRTANQVIGIFTFFLGSVAAISLIVGGIGIMNIMLVSVTERTREIGIRKAVGATRRDILVQFLAEALILTNVGGLTGVLAGLGMTNAISSVDIGGLTLNPSVEIDAIVLAIGFSTMIGLIFGLYPARHAARLNPIEALRYE
jgi:putative ABC transport system permease protein